MKESKRVIYKNNPLIEVILQVKFPTILSINSNDPVDFQEAIKQQYPFYHLAIENEQEIALNLENDNSLPSIVQRNKFKNHNFISKDRNYKINLTSSFLSISTVNYTRWEDLRNKFELPLQTFAKIYNPPFYERIGLRYIDAFSREKLNINEKEWSDLINPIWLGAINIVDEDRVINSSIDVEYKLDNELSYTKVHTGLGNINGDPEKVFIIDSDFIHVQNIEIENFDEIINYLHSNANDFIKDAITDDLHQAMLPEEV